MTSAPRCLGSVVSVTVFNPRGSLNVGGIIAARPTNSSAESSAIVTFIAKGRKLNELKRNRGFSIERIQGTRKKLRKDVLKFFGENILADVGQQPAWKAGIMATRERHAAKAMSSAK